jgi:hypothetical protein
LFKIKKSKNFIRFVLKFIKIIQAARKPPFQASNRHQKFCETQFLANLIKRPGKLKIDT